VKLPQLPAWKTRRTPMQQKCTRMAKKQVASADLVEPELAKPDEESEEEPS